MTRRTADTPTLASPALRTTDDASLPPAERAFQREWARVERIQHQRDDMNRRCEAYLADSTRLAAPLRAQVQADLRTLAHTLAAALGDENAGLSRAQRSTARDVLCQMAEALARQGDADMAALHDRHSPLSLAQKSRDQAQRLKAWLAELLGEDAAGGDAAEDADNPDDLWHAAMAQHRAQAQDKRAQREKARAARAARRASRAGAGGGQPAADPDADAAAAAQQEAQVALRTLYRQLASSLHPDRAGDEPDRLRKTAWMSEANAAYARQDLLALMRLQHEADLVPGGVLDSASQARLDGLTAMLKRQAAELERQRQADQQRWVHALRLSGPDGVSAPALERRLANELAQLDRQLQRLKDDLAQAQTRSGLKAWLNGRSSAATEPVPSADQGPTRPFATRS